MQKQILILLLIAIGIFLTYLYLNQDNISDIRILTEEYKPLQYINENNELDGYAASVVKDILKELNISKEIELTDWDTAYSLILNEDNIALFSTIKNHEREDKFKWVGPIGTLKVNLYKSADSDISINSLDGAKDYKISAVKDYAYTEDLLNLGFKNIVECNSEKEALNKLVNKEVDLYLTSNIAMDELVKSENEPIDFIEKEFNISIDQFYIAFSKNYPDKFITRWQTALEKVKQNSTLLFIEN
ncbi:MAG: transporter substrate-binding domain-containing protein [Candidatus Pacebacteria bacterium]|nr:transporter substrate-binding domain-containing protein [Candidatus Paceibacterota bacterium]